MTAKTLLITSVGSQVAHAILDAIDAAPEMHRRLRIVGVNSQADAPGNFRCDAAFLAPPSNREAAYRDALRRILRVTTPAAVMPGRDDDLDALAELAEESSFASTVFIAPNRAAAAVANDKFESFRFARAHGLPFVETAIDREGLTRIEAESGYPMIAKPRRGRGTVGVTVVRNRSEAEAALATPAYCLQEFLDLPPNLDALLPDLRCGVPLVYISPWTTHSHGSVAIGRGGRILDVYLGRHSLRDGVAVRIETQEDPSLAAAAGALGEAMAALGHRGSISFQFGRRRDGTTQCFEMNGRVGGSALGRTLLGNHDVRLVLADLLFGESLPPALHRSDLIAVRVPAMALMARADVEGLARDGEWHKARDQSGWI